MEVSGVFIGAPPAIRRPGWFTVRELSQSRSYSPASQGAELLILSDAALRAMVSAPLGTPGLDGVFAFEGGDTHGTVAVAAGRAPGSMRIAVGLTSSAAGEAAEVRLEGEVRTGWLQGVAAGARDHAHQAAALLGAVADVAAVAGQGTFTVSVDGVALPAGQALPARVSGFVSSLAYLGGRTDLGERPGQLPNGVTRIRGPFRWDVPARASGGEVTGPDSAAA